MQFALTINIDNAAFEDPAELPKILRNVARLMEQGARASADSGKLRDTNGNTVGSWAMGDEVTATL